MGHLGSNPGLRIIALAMTLPSDSVTQGKYSSSISAST